MGIEEIRKRNEQIENNRLIWQEVRSLEGKTNIEKLKHFNLISKEREKEIREIYFKRYYEEKWEVKVGTIKNQLIDSKKIAGTCHSDYYEKTLFESLNSLKRFERILAELRINPKYYTSDETRDKYEKKISLTYKKHEDKYYITGDGNNRLITVLAIGFPEILVNEICVYDEVNEIKDILLWVRNEGFHYEIEKDIKSVNDSSPIHLFTEDIYMTINGIEKLVIFKEKYEKMNVSNFKLKIYKFNSYLFNEYKNKYRYSDEITHLFHMKYLQLREHKLKMNKVQGD
ncbi:hypothetical protein [Peribacillus butanolivorans]